MKKVKRLLSIAMAVLMLLSIAPLTRTGLQASALNLDCPQITGNPVLDFARIAKNNVNRTGSDLGAPYHWCALFTYECARLAGIGENVIPSLSKCTDLYSAMVNHCGSTPVASPKTGDLVFYYYDNPGNLCHVGIIVDDYGSSIQGNFNGFGDPWYKNSRVVSCYYTDTSYTNRIIVRPAYGRNATDLVSFSPEIRYTVEKNVKVRRSPYKEGDLDRELPNIGTAVTVVGKIRNTRDHIWYKLDDGNWIYDQRLSKDASYIIKYYANGGSNAPKQQIKKKSETIKLSNTIPTRKGYVFLGWGTSKNATPNQVEYKPGATYKKNASLSLYAIWVQKKLNVSLNKYVSELSISDVSRFNKPDDKVYIYVEALSGLAHMLESGLFRYKFNISVSDNSIVKIEEKLNWVHPGFEIHAKKPGEAMVYVDVCDPDNGMAVLAKASVLVQVDSVKMIKYHNKGSTVTEIQYMHFEKNPQIRNYPFDVPSGKAFAGWARTPDAQDVEFCPGDTFINKNQDVDFYPVLVAIDAITHEFDEPTGTLTIGGKGIMPSYTTASPAPWSDLKTKVTKLVFTEEVTSVGANAFRDFTALREVYFTRNIRRLSSYAFYNCSSLTYAPLYQDPILGNYVFGKCTALRDLQITGSSGVMNAPRKTNSNRDTAEASIGAFAFSECVNLQSIEIPNTVTEIGESAFEGCISLQNVELSANLDQLNDTVFFNCDSLESIDLPDSITSIGDGAFSGCASLEDVEIPDSVTEIGDQSFSGCSALESIEIPDSVDVIGSSTFSNCTALSSVTLPDTMDYLGDAMFAGCSSLQSIDLPEEISCLGDGTFQNCTALSSVDIPSTVIEIGDSAFSGCTALQSFTIPENIVAVRDFAFSECSNLASVDFSENLETIGSCAFSFCETLESASLPGSLAEIQSGAFLGCTSLQSVDFDTDADLTIGDEAFSGCSALSNIILPASVVSMGDNVFSDCSAALSVQCYSTSAAHDEIVEKVAQCVTIVPVESIAFDAENYSLKKGESLTLVPVIEPATATDKTVFWSSSNEDIAMVDEEGNVTVQGTGSATISVFTEDGNHLAECEVECSIPVTGIAFSEEGTEAYVGDTLYPLYLMTPSNASNIAVQLTSPDDSVVSIVDETVKVIGPGSAVITVETEDGGFTDTFTVTANEYVPMDSLTLSKETVELEVGQSEQISVSVLPNNASNQNVYWFSADPDIASIDENGKVTAVAAGTTEIGVYSMDITTAETIKVTVTVPADPCANGHAYVVAVTAPTCTDRGYTTHTCSRCNDQYVDSYVDALGHTAPDEYGNCARCGIHIVDTCKWCGKVHEGFFQKIIAFFHNIFASIFGAKY